MTRQSIRTLLTSGLGFCCPWAGLEANRSVSSEMLGTRLGVSGRAVRYQWEAVVSGDLRCENCRGCMKAKLEERARARKIV